MVADAINKASGNLWVYSQLMKLPVDARPEWAKLDASYRLALAVHDELILEVPVSSIEPVIDHVLPLCMHKFCRVPELEFSLEIDVEILLRWNEKPSRDELEKLGVPSKYLS